MDGVTVVIPCYNGARHLRACLDSAVAQEYDGGLEILVGDDGSTDDSAAIAGSYGPPVRVLRHAGDRNRGAPATRNLCLREATRPLVAFLDADDVWLPGHLRVLAEALHAAPAAGLAYANGYNLSAGGKRLGPRLSEPHRPRTTAAELLLDQCFPPAAVMVRRHVFDVVGLFDEELTYVEDHDMWVRILEHFPAVYAPHFGYLYRLHPNQLTSNGPMLWHQSERLLEKARAREIYAPNVLRRRSAVIAFRKGQAALGQRQYLRGGYQFGKAALRDPVRAVSEGLARLLGRGTP
jgi:glycosyltransferase involved in cell wall biosynthesis